MTALSRLLSGHRHVPIDLRSEMTDTMTDLSRLLSGDQQVPIDLRTEMLWYRCTNTFRAPRLGIRTIALQLPHILLELQC